MTKVNTSQTTINNHLISSEVLTFLVDRQARRLSKNTLHFYQGELNKFATFLESIGITRIGNITPDSIRQYLIELASHRNAGGCHAAYRVIKVFLRWYAQEIDDIGLERLIRKVPAPKVTNQPQPGITMEQINALIATCPKSFIGFRDKAIFYMLLDTGLRRSEFVSLNIDDIDFHNGSVKVRNGKGDKERVTFIGAVARKEILRYLRKHPDPKQSSPLWVTSTGKRLTAWGLRQILRRRAVIAKVPEPQLHDFRRAFAIQTLRNGGDLVRLSHMMGHSDLKTTQRYLHITLDDLRQSHEMTSPADKL